MDLFSCLSPLVFCSLSSGSDGNCYFIGTERQGVLVDAGISARSIKKMLGEVGYQMSQVKAVFVTHDHIDHIAGLQTLVNKHCIPLYADADCLEGIYRNYSTKDINKELCHTLEDKHSVDGINVEPFAVSHDGRGAHGYYFEYEGSTLTIATDLGFISDENAGFLNRSDSIVIESNYDNDMLWNGPYTYLLKKRISSQVGHLSNTDAAAFIAKNYRPTMKNIMLCHLSANNNTTESALQTVYATARRNKVKFSAQTSVFALPRTTRTELIGL